MGQEACLAYQTQNLPDHVLAANLCSPHLDVILMQLTLKALTLKIAWL